VSDLRTCLAANSEVFEGQILAGVKEEAVLVTNILSQPEGIMTATKSAQEALDVLASSHIFHYAGHGTWARRRLMDSAFRLDSDSELKVCNIVAAPLRHPVLAYLSQCSATSGPTLGSATGMLLSGFKSIITTMWCVTKSTALTMYAYHQSRRDLYDEDGPVLAEAFYQSWLTNGRDGLVSLQDIPYALDDACAVLRAAGRVPNRWGALIHIGA
jgi:CHAT domain-containing protein